MIQKPSAGLLVIVILAISQSSCRIVYPEGLWPMNSFGEFSA
jgi:hypothetical protein